MDDGRDHEERHNDGAMHSADPLIDFTLWNEKSPTPSPSLFLFQRSSTPLPPYFWGNEPRNSGGTSIFPTHAGYNEARSLIGDGSLKRLEELTNEALNHLAQVFGSLASDHPPPLPGDSSVVKLRLSDDLQQWREAQQAQGRVLPSKGHGLQPVAPAIRKLLGAEKWPAPMVTQGALWGAGMMNLCQGAADARTLVLNYRSDLAFYVEHGYQLVFPDFEALVRTTTTTTTADTDANFPQRAAAVDIGLRYIRAKVHLEEAHKAHIGSHSASMTRRTAQILFFAESSLLGLAQEAMARGFDAGAVFADHVWSCPATDVVDVGRDLHNSEMFNSFLNTADVTDTGVVTEAALRAVYDAYAHAGARSFVGERWAEPSARMLAHMYKWHFLNDRHRFLRLAVLGFAKVRKLDGPHMQQQREADFDEAFDACFRSTGFSRPLEGACNGGDPCDAVQRLVQASSSSSGQSAALLRETWLLLVTAPVAYAAAGEVDATREDGLVEELGCVLARAFSAGLVFELSWLFSHASQHAWQVNYIMEAAMFGSLLDDGALEGKLDRVEV